MSLFQDIYSIAKDYAKIKSMELIDEVINSNYQIKMTDNKLSLNIKSPNKSKIEWIIQENENGEIYTSKLDMKLGTPIGKINYRR